VAVAEGAVAEGAIVAGAGVTGAGVTGAGVGVADELHPTTALISNPIPITASALGRGRMLIRFMSTSI
jgi:hypothetical protein